MERIKDEEDGWVTIQADGRSVFHVKPDGEAPLGAGTAERAGREGGADDAILDRFEHEVLAALGMSSDDPPYEALAAAYDRLSAGYVSTHRSALHPDREDVAVRGLTYAARTLHLGAAILSAYPAPDGPLAEIGSGLGPFAFAASALGRQGPFTLVDRSAELLAVAQRLAHWTATGALEARCVDAFEFLRTRAGGEFLGIALPYSLLEISGSSGVSPLDLVLHATRLLSPGGRLYVLEPGDHNSGRALSELRSELLLGAPDIRIVAPCTHEAPCPRLARESDWCHLTWPIGIGPVGRRLADLARRRHSEVHFSFLVLERRDASAAENDRPASFRLLETRRSGPGKRILRVCGASGERTLIGLTRDKKLHGKLDTLRAGAIVRLDESKLSRKGDGERLESEQALDIVTAPL